MTIRFACPTCSRSYAAPDAAAGKRTKCPACGERLMVPEAQAEEPAPRPPRPGSTAGDGGSRDATPWRRYAPAAALSGVALIALYALVQGLSRSPAGNHLPPASTPPGPSAAPGPAWPSELQRQLGQAREAVRTLIEKDQTMRRDLPRLKREAQANAAAEFPGLAGEFAQQAAEREFVKRKAEWQLFVSRKMVEIGAALHQLREQFGMQDPWLAEEVSSILAELKHFEKPWAD